MVHESYMSSTTGTRFSMSYQFRVSSVNILLYQWATLGQCHTSCAATFPGRPGTAGRVPAMDAGCGLSTSGHWDGPVICNEGGAGDLSVCRATWRTVPCEHAEAPCLGHSPPCCDGSMRILVGSSAEGFEQVPA